MLLLDNPVQTYDWGSIDGLAALIGTAATGGPEAELWVGTHDRGPSVIAAGPDAGTTLAAAIARDPVGLLGPDLVAAGCDRLPFLLKVLAIGSALSLQAHPTAAQAEEGYRREDAAGVPLDGPTRTYRDRSPKPEALVALTDTFALCGFRPEARAIGLLRLAGSPDLDPLAKRLGGGATERATGDALGWLLGLEAEHRVRVARAAVEAASALGTGEPDDPWTWVGQLAQQHPGDPTCLAPVLLEVVHLQPGEGIHLPAGNLHAYLVGGGVEIMAASDNVLRGGLTTKHIDVDGLLGALDLEPGVPAAPVRAVRDGWTTYDANEDHFGLARLDPGGRAVAGSTSAPSLLLALRGSARMHGTAETIEVAPGRAAFVPPGERVDVEAGGEVWWATTGTAMRA